MVAIHFGGPKEQTYIILNIIFCSMGVFASLLNIVLIYLMKLSNPCISLLSFMTNSQLISTFVLFFVNVYCGYYWMNIAFFVRITCEISGSLISNWISFIAFYIIYYNKSIDMNSKLLSFMYFTSFFPGLLTGIVFLIASIPQSQTNIELQKIAIEELYFYIKLFSIIINFSFAYLIISKIYQMNSKNHQKSLEEMAIQVFSYRIFLYPIVQSLSRLGPAWYQKAYGYEYDDADDVSQTQYDCLLMVAILTPLANIGYLVIFLLQQPNAWKYLYRLVGFDIVIHPPTTLEEKLTYIPRPTIGLTSSTPSLTEDPSIRASHMMSEWYQSDWYVSQWYHNSKIDISIKELEYEELIHIINQLKLSEQNEIYQMSNPIQDKNNNNINNI